MNNGLVWLAVVWGALLLAFCLMGCRTKSVVEFVEVHDTVRMAQTDTVREYQWKTVHDTLRLSDVVTVTVRESGETIRVDRWRDRWKVVERHDTVDRYRAKYDSLLAVVSQVKEKEVVIKRPWYSGLGWVMIGAIVALAVKVVIARRGKSLKR
jgi:hypothetical protein